MMWSLHVVVHCRPTGQVQLPGESDDPTRPGISVPQGKLA